MDNDKLKNIIDIVLKKTDKTESVIIVNKLSSIVSYIQKLFKSNKISKAKNTNGGILISIINYNEVKMTSNLLNEWQTTSYSMVCKIHDRKNKIIFGEWYGLESFCMHVISSFVEDENSKLLLRTINRLKNEDIFKMSINGFIQSTILKNGIDNYFLLKPYNTFPEVQQPTIRFNLKVAGKDLKDSKFALFDFNDYNWQLDCIYLIAEYLRENINQKDVIINV